MNRSILAAIALAALCAALPAAHAAKKRNLGHGVPVVLLEPEKDAPTEKSILEAVCAPVDPPNAEPPPDPAPNAPLLAHGLVTQCTIAGGWVYRGPSTGQWFVIDNTIPSFTEVRRTPSGYFAPRAWSLADLDVGTPGLDLQAMPRQRISAALYPATDGDRYTIALEHNFSEGYSGGGGMWTWMWLVSLRDAEPRVIDRYGQLPSSCNQMIRACFSEKDYRRGGRCHDEYSGGLRITTARSHPWRMVWSYREDTSTPNGGGSWSDRTVLRFVADGPGRFRNTEALKSCGDGPQ